MWSRLGAEVTVVEFLDNIVPGMVSWLALLSWRCCCLTWTAAELALDPFKAQATARQQHNSCSF